RTRALVVINPNNPTGAVYPRPVLEALAGLAERCGLIVFSDEIYDQMTYDDAEFVPLATLVHDTLCATLAGLSKVYRACGYRVGWAVYAFVGVDTGELANFDDQQFALDLLEQQHVLVAPGVSFNVPYRNHFRVTTLPDAAMLRDVFERIEGLLTEYASAPRELSGGNVVEATTRFK